MRTVLVIIHASAGIVGLVAGIAALVPPRARRDRWQYVRSLYAVSIATLLASLLALIAVDWRGLEIGSRLAFTALAGLGVVMVVRLILARRLAGSQPSRWADRYLGHVYFTYISLWVGFVVLPALDLPLPQLTVPLCALLVLGFGHVLLGRYRRKLLGETDRQPH